MIKAAWSLWWNSWGWQLKLVSLFGVAVLLLIVVGTFKACTRSEPKLNQREIIEAQQAIDKQQREKMIEILADSEAREQGIDNSVKAAENAAEEAKKNYTGKSNEELAEELNRRAKQ